MDGSARRCLLSIFSAFLVVLGPGCSRKFFRERADCDVEGIISQKNRFPAWAVKNWHVYPDTRARFADPFNPDRPPYPPDDYASRILSPNPQHPHKKSGVGRVDGEGYLQLLEQWDAQNRAGEPARGAPPEPALPVPPDWPATLHQPEPAGAVVPAGGVLRSVPAASGSFLPAVGEWVPAKSHFTPPLIDSASVGPRVTEVRGPTLVLGHEIEPAGPPIPPIPTSAVVPTQPPAVLPDLPIAAAQEPKPIDPKQPLPVPRPVDPVPSTKPPAMAESIFGTGEAAAYQRALYSNQQGYRIKIEQAIELGLINSREFQDRREDLYLAALPVTLERFNFATQAFFTESVLRKSIGSQLTGAGEFWDVNTTGGFSKRLPTGAAVLVQLANQVVIDLGSKKPTVAVSNLSLSALQPFLRGGGLAVNLENLTEAERTMVYAMRSYARFRKLFFVATLGGQISALGLTNNPYGLQGLSVNLGRGIGQNLTAPTIGFLPLLQSAAIINNQQKNVAALEAFLRLYEAFREGGQYSDLQVGLVEVTMLNARASLLGPSGGGAGNAPSGSIRGYLDSLDNFKLQLGLPLTVGLDLDNTLLKPVRHQLARFEDVYADLRRLEEEARKFNPSAPVNQFRARWLSFLTESDLVKDTGFAKSIGPRWDAWSKLSADQMATRAAGLRKERIALLDQKAERQRKGEPEPDAEIKRLIKVEAELDLWGLEQAIRYYESQPWAKEKGTLRNTIQAGAFRDSFNAFYQVSLEGRNERLEITRNEWPALPTLPVEGTDILTAPLDEAYTAGIQAALSNRLDLMNARGQVVDAYRQVAVQANSLQGVFNVQYNYNAGTPAGGNQAFGFSGSRTTHQLAINAELPLVRRAERNNYRAALIGYQRQRRTLMAFEDNIANDVRNDIRELRTLAELFKIQQRVVELAYSQVDNAQAVLLAPPVPVTGGGASSNDAGNAAALTQQLLNTQSNLLQAQNTLYSYWVSYLNARMALYLDLELMQLDDRGVWNDEQFIRTIGAAGSVPAQRGERLPLPQPVGPADRK